MQFISGVAAARSSLDIPTNEETEALPKVATFLKLIYFTKL